MNEKIMTDLAIRVLPSVSDVMKLAEKAYNDKNFQAIAVLEAKMEGVNLVMEALAEVLIEHRQTAKITVQN